MAKKYLNTWFWSIMVLITWYFVNSGLMLLLLGSSEFLAIIMLVLVLIMWVVTLAGILPNNLYKQDLTLPAARLLIYTSMGLVTLIAVLFALVIVITPDNPTAQGAFFGWSQVTAYIGLPLTIILFVLSVAKAK